MNMDVSENSGTPKSSILIGFSNTNYLFWGTPIFGNTQISFYYLFLQQSEVDHNFSFSENQFGRRVNLHGCCLETPMFLLFFHTDENQPENSSWIFLLDVFLASTTEELGQLLHVLLPHIRRSLQLIQHDGVPGILVMLEEMAHNHRPHGNRSFDRELDRTLRQMPLSALLAFITCRSGPLQSVFRHLTESLRLSLP